MQSDCEIRKSAWRTMWERKWFWKLIGASILLNAASQAVVQINDGILNRLGVMTVSKLQGIAHQHGTMPEFNANAIWQLSSSLLLMFFLSFVMGSVMQYGFNALLLRTTEDDDGNGWMKTAFSGYKMPLELTWLAFRVAVVYAAYGAVGALPAGAFVACLKFGHLTPVEIGIFTAASVSAYIAMICIPFYRYRYLFRIKAEHPDWSASQCMRSCRELTDGYKWRIFSHDCSYWRIMLLALLPLAAVAVVCGLLMLAHGTHAVDAALHSNVILMAFGVLALLPAYLIFIALSVITAMYVSVGQTILYREISRERQTQDKER